ncbi:MAG: DUF559 domain-containing protein [Bacteroidetes bacterium]|nr:DUF559 domain-containing protein [Bacteroidota bacterium]
MTENKNLKIFAREKRNNSTYGEILLWKNLLSRKKTGYQFNRQFPIDRYIVDFISRTLKLIIEVDGYSHQFKHEKDVDRDKRLNQQGYSVIRFTEHDIKYNFGNVARTLNIYIEEFLEKGTIPLAPFFKGEESDSIRLKDLSKGNAKESIP